MPVVGVRKAPKITFKGLGKPFLAFMIIVGLFDLGNSSDAFLVLRARERGLNVLGILGMLITFNLVYTLLSTPAGALSDRVGRRRVIVSGWLAYAAIYLGFAIARTGWHVWVLYALYGVYYGLAYGTVKALVADIFTRNYGIYCHKIIYNVLFGDGAVVAYTDRDRDIERLYGQHSGSNDRPGFEQVFDKLYEGRGGS